MKAEKLFKKFKKNLKARLNSPVNLNLFLLFKALFILLAVVSMIIWIFVGGAISLFIIQAARQGTLERALGTSVQGSRQVQEEKVQQPQQTQQPQPTEANIPGVGRVNIVCVKNALSDTSIKNLVVAESVSVLTADEKTRFEKCLIK